MTSFIIGRDGSVTEGLPLFMRKNGVEMIMQKQKELETYLKCLETYPLNWKILNEKTCMITTECICSEWYYNRQTKKEYMEFLLNSTNHKVDGKVWNNGDLGSRWADTMINGKKIRLAFYTRKNDTMMFVDEKIASQFDYAIVMDSY